MLFTGCEVRMRKTVPEVLKTAQGRGTFSRPRAQFFSSGPKLPVNNVFYFFIHPLDNNNDYIRDRRDRNI